MFSRLLRAVMFGRVDPNRRVPVVHKEQASHWECLEPQASFEALFTTPAPYNNAAVSTKETIGPVGLCPGSAISE